MEDDERHGRRHTLAQLITPLPLHEVGRIQSLGERHDAQAQPAPFRELRGAEHRRLPSPVRVEAQLERPVDSDHTLEL